MLLGNLIKEKRKKIGLSQKELMSGIGSLVMISKIENENKAPSVDSLIKVLNKLDLTLNDVFSEYTNTTTSDDCRLFMQCELFFYNENYKSFQSSLHSLDELDNNCNQDNISFLRGLYFLFVKESNDDAIFELNEALQNADIDHHLKLLIFALLGKAYQSKKMTRAASKYFSHNIEYNDLENGPLSTINALRAISTLYYTAEFLYSKDIVKADRIAKQALTLSTEYHLSHYTDKIVQLLAKSSSSNKNIVASYQRIANVFQQLNQKLDI